MSRPRTRARDNATMQVILEHRREAVSEDRLARLVKDATRTLVCALQMRPAEHSVSHGHWTYLPILWERGGLTQRVLGAEAGNCRAWDREQANLISPRPRRSYP